MMKISARNRFSGTVKSIEPGAVNSEVKLALPSGREIVAIVTRESVDRLSLKEGQAATALVKASSVLVAVGDPVVTSARNTFTGVVASIHEGAVNGEVRLELSGGEAVTATITNASIRRLGLEPGVEATALVKASSVLLAL